MVIRFPYDRDQYHAMRSWLEEHIGSIRIEYSTSVFSSQGAVTVEVYFNQNLVSQESIAKFILTWT